VGWNQIATIGPSLAKAAAGGILLLALLDRRRDWASLPVGWLIRNCSGWWGWSIWWWLFFLFPKII